MESMADNLNKVAQISVTEVELYQIRDGYPLEPRDKLKIYKRGNVTIDGIKLSNKPKKIRITYTELVKLSELRGEGMIDPYPNLRGAAWNKRMDDWKRVGANSDKKRAKEIRQKMGIESDGENENENEDGSVADMAQDYTAGDENDEDEDDEMDDFAAAEEEIVPVLDGDIKEDEGVGFASAPEDEVGLGGGEEDNEDGAARGKDIAAAAIVGGVERFDFERTLGEVRVEDDTDARRLAEELAKIGAQYPFGGDFGTHPNGGVEIDFDLIDRGCY